MKDLFKSLTVVASTVALCGLVGCASPEDNMGPIEHAPDAIAPVINSETGEVSDGSLKFAPSFYDDNNVANVLEAVKQNCLVEHGYDGDKLHWKAADPIMLDRSAAGVWREKDAESFGFATPMSPAELLLNRVSDSTQSAQEKADAQAEVDSLKIHMVETKQNMSSAAYAAANAVCAKDPEVTKWQKTVDSEHNVFGGPWWDQFTAAGKRAYGDPRIKAIGADYDACLARSGLTRMSPDGPGYDGTFFIVKGEDGTKIDEQQITMALAVVACKTSGDLVNRLMSIVAEYEAPVYVKYRSELDDRAGKVADLRAEVSAYWAAHGE